jgi:hypothetical protein
VLRGGIARELRVAFAFVTFWAYWRDVPRWAKRLSFGSIGLGVICLTLGVWGDACKLWDHSTVPYPPLATASPLYTQNYANLGNVAHANLPATMQVGGLPVQYEVEPPGSTNAQFIITNGGLTVTNIAGAPIGAYVAAGPLPNDVTQVGIDFYMGTPGSTAAGVVNVSTLGNGPGALVWPPAYYGTHTVVAQTYVQMGGEGSLRYEGAPFPLAMDHTTVHHLDVYLGGDTATVYVDGVNCGSSTAAGIETYSLNWVFWEVSIGNPTDNQPAILAARVQ